MSEGGGAPRHLLGVVVAMVIAAVVFVGAVFAVRSDKGLGYEPAASPATTGRNVSLSVFPDSHPCHGNSSGAVGGGAHSDWVTYCSTTSIRVPAYSTITVTIKQYDTASGLHNPFFAQVHGTVGGVMYVNGRPERQAPPDIPGHTFTIQTPPNSNETQLFVSVPLVGVPDSAPNAVTIGGEQYPRPEVIVFRFKTGKPGEYVWHCYVPCGTGLAGDGIGGQDNFGGPMATTGYMAGTLTVT